MFLLCDFYIFTKNKTTKNNNNMAAGFSQSRKGANFLAWFDAIAMCFAKQNAYCKTL